jgi:soluble lytic murein transglycosylase-like protein
MFWLIVSGGDLSEIDELMLLNVSQVQVGRMFVALLTAGFCAVGAEVAADDVIFSTKSRKSIYASQLNVLDGRATNQYSSSVNLKPQSFAVPTASLLPYTGSYKGEYLHVAKSMAQKHGVPADLFLRLVQQESGWKPQIRSHAGAIGLAQLMPGTAAFLGVDPTDPRQNLEGGARYLKQMYNKFGTWRLALAAYNAGPGAVQKYGGIPPYKETQNYVKVILGS